MTNFDPTLYRGHLIFRNQPNHSYFDKPFDENDCLFQCLHEIDPHFLKTEYRSDTINFTDTSVTDPRNKKPLVKILYDYTKEEKTIVFHSPKKSLMTEKQHEVGVRVLNLLQQQEEVQEEDMFIWYRLQNMRIKENQLFQKFAFEFTQKNKDKMYTPCRKIFDLYQKWYNSISSRFSRRYPQQAYNTHLGLPHVRLCKNVLSDEPVEIKNQESVRTIGDQLCWQGEIKEMFKTLNYTISSYAEVFKNSEDLKDSLEENLKLQFQKIVEEETAESPTFYIPLDSLLFLLTAGDYVDLPKVLLLNIKEVNNLENGTIKYIIMDQPLPSEQCGWHTYEEIVEQAAQAMISIKQTKYSEKESLQASVSPKSPCFKTFTLQDFMEKSTVKADKLCKFSKTLTKWQLTTGEHDKNLQIYTTLNLFEENKSIMIKLEYKPRFGCETLTKYKLLKEWLKLKLGASESICLRLDVTSYQTLLEEKLSSQKLEEYLKSIYQISCGELLKNLFEFLKMLYTMPLGHYMLRYNPKFKDKVLLCKPSQEITQNTVHLHQLLSDRVTDVEFLSQKNFLKIEENLCSLMHLQHKILPATFSPFVTDRKSKTRQIFCSKPKNSFTQTKNESKKYGASKNRLEYKTRTNRSKIKRTNRKRRKFEKFQAESEEMEEMKQEMELDLLMLTNL